jgi:hypothetical protein
LTALEAQLAQAAAPEAIGRLEARLNETAGQVQELRDRPSRRPFRHPGRCVALRTRLDELGNQLAAAPTQNQVAGLEAAVQRAATADQVAALETQLAAAPTEERVVSLEAALAETRGQAEKAATLGPAIAANALTSALEAGAPYRAELDALRALGLEPAAIEGLAAHADAGCPRAGTARRL